MVGDWVSPAVSDRSRSRPMRSDSWGERRRSVSTLIKVRWVSVAPLSRQNSSTLRPGVGCPLLLIDFSGSAIDNITKR